MSLELTSGALSSVAEKKEPEFLYKILAVDDDAMILTLISRFFPSDYYKVIRAENGFEALSILETEVDIDLVILDLMMPGMNGFEVTRKIRETHPLFELPIIILTARNTSDAIVEAFKSGANDYITKPFDRNELIARANTHIKLKRLTKANNILQEAVDIKNKFIQMTIHDLRNPLTVVIGLTNLMKMDTVRDSENYEYMNLIIESSELMLNMVNELLNTARLEGGKLNMKRESIDMNELIQKVIDKNRRHAYEKGQEIHFLPESFENCEISSDNIRVHEIADNILSNAIKYSPRGGNIFVSLKQYNQNEGHYIRFEIKDEGPGMTDDDKLNLFGKFQRLSAIPTGGESSSGLGLSIVKQLLELLGGRIWVESEYGKGSNFIVELPDSY
jgi:signal transduction histidine kinase